MMTKSASKSLNTIVWVGKYVTNNEQHGSRGEGDDGQSEPEEPQQCEISPYVVGHVGWHDSITWRNAMVMSTNPVKVLVGDFLVPVEDLNDLEPRLASQI